VELVVLSHCSEAESSFSASAAGKVWWLEIID
jgi:hypothetical protein